MSIGSPTVDVEVEISRGKNSRKRGRKNSQPNGPSPRIPRITRLMALAIKFQGMIDRGEVRDYAEIARLGFVTRARLTQIMNLLLLAPDLQEQLLLSATTVEERCLRNVAKMVEWREQKKCFTIALDKQKRNDALAG